MTPQRRGAGWSGARRGVQRALAASTGLVARRSSRRRVIGLCYHSIHPSLSFASASPDLFERHLAWLTEFCEVIPFGDMLRATEDQLATRPAVAITFDDGYADNYEFAFPLLKKYQLDATVFVTAGLCAGDPAVSRRFQQLRGTGPEEIRPLTWSQIGEMKAGGIEFGAHTYGHPNLLRLSQKEVLRELRVSKEILEERLAAPIDTLAYPFGKPGRQFDESTARAAEVTGYAQAAAILFRSARPTDSCFALPRFFATRDSVRQLSDKVRGDWDYLGLWQERAPRSVARVISPQDFRF